MIYTVKIYGKSEARSGYPFEIIDCDQPEPVVVHSAVSQSVEQAEVEANRWIDELAVTPVKIYTREVPDF